MNYTTAIPILAVALAVHTAVAAEPADVPVKTEVAASARTEFRAFQIIQDRNIFNPNRSAKSGNPRPRRAEGERREPSETFTLLGTMSYEKGAFAFFGGSSSRFRTVLQPAESIAGFKITEVQHTCVKLVNTNGETLQLCVGMEMKRRDEEPWQLVDRIASGKDGGAADDSDETVKRMLQRREEEGGAGGAGGESASKPAVAPEETKVATNTPAAEEDDVVKKLLQKREQDLNK